MAVRRESLTAGQSSAPAPAHTPVHIACTGRARPRTTAGRNSPRFATCPGRVCPTPDGRPIYSPLRPPRRPPLHRSPDASPTRVGPRVPVTDDPDHTWRRIESELRQRVPRRPTRSGSPRCASCESPATTLVRRGARASCAPGSPSASRRCCRRARPPSSGRTPSRSCSSATMAAPRPTATRPRAARAPRRRPRDRRRRPQPEVHLRAVRHRRRQPLRPRRRARRRRAARPGLQPALHLRAARASARPISCTRSATTSAPRRRLTVRYTTVETFTNEFIAAITSSVDRPLQGAASADSDVLLIDDVQFLAAQGEDRGGVLPHVQRALRGRQPARPDVRPPPARPRRARGPPARALRVRPRHRDRARPTSPTRLDRSCASASSTTASSSTTRRCSTLIAERVPTNVRALEGALIRVVAYALAHRPPARRARSPREVLGDLYPAGRPPDGSRDAGRRSTSRRRADASASPRGDPLPRPPPALASAARSPCTSRASTRARPCPRSAGGSAAATTRPSCTPAGAPPSASPRDPESFEPFGA